MEDKSLDYYFFTFFCRLKLSKLYSPSSSEAFGDYFFRPARTHNTPSPNPYAAILQYAEGIQICPVDGEPDGKQEIKEFLASKRADIAIQKAYYQIFKYDLKILALGMSIGLLLALPVVREVLVSTAVLTGLVFGIAYLCWQLKEKRQELKKECFIPEIQKLQSFVM